MTRAEVAARRSRVLELRALGLTVPAIAKALESTTAIVKKDIQRALVARQDDYQGEREFGAELELARLDGMLRTLSAIEQNAKESHDDRLVLRTIGAQLQVFDRRVALLGLAGQAAGDKPAAGNGGLPDEIKRRRDRKLYGGP